jgi:hypothetical protein
VKATVIPIINGTCGCLSLSIQKHLHDISGKHSIMELKVGHSGHSTYLQVDTNVRPSLISNVSNTFYRKSLKDKN